MAKFPWPPDADVLRRVTADHRLLRPGTLMARIYARGGSHPTTWRAFRVDGPLPGARFDHHVAGDRRGVLYAAGSFQTCVAEVFQGSRVIDRFAADRCLAAFRLARSVRLLNLTRDWPTRAGGSQAIAAGPRPRAQAWARAIYEAYPNVEGIWYPSSMHGGHPAVVLFERAEPALPSMPDLDVPLSHPGLLPDLVRTAGSPGPSPAVTGAQRPSFERATAPRPRHTISLVIGVPSQASGTTFGEEPFAKCLRR